LRKYHFLKSKNSERACPRQNLYQNGQAQESKEKKNGKKLVGYRKML